MTTTPKPITGERQTGGVMKLDLRDRCLRCNEIPRGKARKAEFERYKPFCSYHCKEWYGLEQAQRYINRKYG